MIKRLMVAAVAVAGISFAMPAGAQEVGERETHAAQDANLDKTAAAERGRILRAGTLVVSHQVSFR